MKQKEVDRISMSSPKPTGNKKGRTISVTTDRKAEKDRIPKSSPKPTRNKMDRTTSAKTQDRQNRTESQTEVSFGPRTS